MKPSTKARPAVVLRKPLAKAIRGGHPWIYREALDIPAGLPDGAVVDVRTRDGQVLATGFLDPRSPIAVRVLGAERIADTDALLQSRLEEALRKRTGRFDPARTNAFRWVHGEADLLPGIHVDLYDDVAGVRFDGEGAKAFYAGIAEKLGKARPLRAVVDRLGGKALAGTPPSALEVLENGLRFEVQLAGGKGGLFLDQRENRALVEGRSAGKSVLNLFGYTGGFALYAARGGATLTVTVDASAPAIASAKRNFKLNGLTPSELRVADAFEFLEEAVQRRKTWDLVISDPPSFAKNKEGMAEAWRTYGRLHGLAAQVTVTGGTLCAASCSSHLRREDFLKNVSSSIKSAGRRFDLEEVRGAGFDHPVLPAFPEGDYLKFAVGRIA